MNSSKIFLSIVIPAYNEEKRLPPNLLILRRWLKRQKFTSEIIVVNDGSTDTTSSRLAGLNGATKYLQKIQVISYSPNRGKGYAVKKGILAARGKIIVFMDADLAVPIKYLQKVITAVDSGADIAIGSRFIKGAKILTKPGRVRNFFSQLYYFLIKILFSLKVSDTQCGFKGFRNEVAKKIFRSLKSSSVLFDLEIFLLAKKFKFQIKEIPVTWKHHPESRLTYNLIKIFLVFRELLKMKLIYK